MEYTSILKAAQLGQASPDPSYALRVEESDKMRLHAEGYKTREKLALYRPHLPDSVRDSQMSNARLITRTHFERLINTFAKVLTASDYRTLWTDNATGEYPAMIEGYREYIENQYPFYGGSLDSWIMQVALPAKLIEANGVFACVRTEHGPAIKAFRADQVYYHLPGYLAILKDGACIYVYKPEMVNVYTKKTEGSKETWTVETMFLTFNPETNTGFKFMFCQPIGGRVFDVTSPDVYGSICSGVVPYWDAAFVANFDMNHSIKDHAYPLMAIYSQGQCGTCNGTGEEKLPGLAINKHRQCGTCGGSGFVSQISPYGHITVRPARADEGDVPNPPAVYVERNMGPIEFLRDYIRQCVYDGYASQGFDYLGQEQLNQSGVAKDYDREPVRATLSAFAESFIGSNIRWMDAALVVAKYRCNGNIYSQAEIKEVIGVVTPTRVIPVEFDVLTSSGTQSMLKAAREAGADAFTLASLEQEYALRAVGNDVDMRQVVEMRGYLDPMAGLSLDQKVLLRDTGGVTNEDYIVSVNIERLIRMVMAEIPHFVELDNASKDKLIRAKAKAIVPQMAAPVDTSEMPPLAPEAETEVV